MTILSPATSPGHQLKRFAAMLAVACVAAIALVAGQVLGKSIAWQDEPLESLARAALFFFAIFAACALIGILVEILLTATPRFRSEFGFGTLRALIRRRWQDDRTEDEYLKVEAGLLIPLVTVGALILFLALPTDASLNGLVFILMAITGCFIYSNLRSVLEKPVFTVIFTVIQAFGTGYFLF